MQPQRHRRWTLLPLVRELNRLGGEHGVGRSDVVEDRLFGIKSREFYEAPDADDPAGWRTATWRAWCRAGR